MYTRDVIDIIAYLPYSEPRERSFELRSSMSFATEVALPRTPKAAAAAQAGLGSCEGVWGV